jgi:hypothetical protein
MEVEKAMTGDLEELGSKDAAISHHHTDVERHVLLDDFEKLLPVLRLGDPETMGAGVVLDRGWDRCPGSPLRPVWLGDHQPDLMIRAQD